MKASLKGLPDALSGGAWPSSARAVRCPVKSGNERDPRPLLLPVPPGAGHSGGTAPVRGRKVRATIGQYAPNPLGYTRAAMAGTKGCDPERGSKSPKPGLSPDRGLQPALVKAESLVTVDQNADEDIGLQSGEEAMHS